MKTVIMFLTLSVFAFGADQVAAPHTLTNTEKAAIWQARAKALEAQALDRAAMDAIEKAKAAEVTAASLSVAFKACGDGQAINEQSGDLVCVAVPPAASK